MSSAPLKRSSLFFSLALFFWPLLTIMTMHQGPVSSQLLKLSERFWPHALNFGLAFCIAPLFLLMLFHFIRELKEKPHALFIRLASFFYLVYLLLVSISYASQIAFKWLFMTQHTSLTHLLDWYFYQKHSLVAIVNQSGYLAFSIATLLLFIPLCSSDNSRLRTINLLLILSSLLQITASLALFLSIPYLDHLTLPAGLLLLPAGIMIHLYARDAGQRTT